MENIAEIKDRVTCLNLICFFISEFLALESSGSWESKEEGRSQQIICSWEATLPFLKSNLDFQQVGVF